jgi:uncharacterized membrane protein YhaH (DUF805 family)
MMNAIDAIRTGFAKSFQFSGRASRAEFWWLFGAAFLLTTAAQLFGLLIILKWLPDVEFQSGPVTLSNAPFALLLIVSAAFFGAIMLAPTARRFQDRGWSGRVFRGVWFVLPLTLVFVIMSVVGYIRRDEGLTILGVLLGFLSIFPSYGAVVWTFWIGFLKGDPSTNKYGPNPYEVPS